MRRSQVKVIRISRQKLNDKSMFDGQCVMACKNILLLTDLNDDRPILTWDVIKSGMCICNTTEGSEGAERFFLARKSRQLK